MSSVDDCEIGLGFAGMKVAVDAAEIVDFALGWFFLDILKDDYGWR